MSNIIEKICRLLHDFFDIPYEMLSEQTYDSPLSGPVFHLNEIQLTYLFFEVEKQFHIKIDAYKVLHYEFNTIRGVAHTIQNSLTPSSEQ